MISVLTSSAKYDWLRMISTCAQMASVSLGTRTALVAFIKDEI